MNNNIWAIILAAGKGSRMKLKDRNKVALEVAGEPLITRTVGNLKGAGIKNILVVVGYAQNSVVSLLDKNIKTALQRKRLGTGHAVKIALKHLPAKRGAVLVVYGDDSYLYTPDILQKLIRLYREKSPALCFLTTEVENPAGLGRILRNQHHQVVGIVEEKDAAPEQKLIKEINPACYIFSTSFLQKYLPKISKNPLKGEYYLTDLIRLAVKYHEPLESLKVEKLKWRGVNTVEELKEAEQLLGKSQID